MDVTVEGPLAGEFRWRITVPRTRADADVGAGLARGLDRAGDGAIQLWVQAVDDPTLATGDAHGAALAAGFEPYRDLWQLRCSLPNSPSGLTTRALTDADIDDFIAVNNRAFQWHPEQGGLTRDQVDATMAEPWFDPEGFRLYHEGADLVGFCWTKVHDTDPPMGEIYVIAIDPSRHGRGLGKPMTLAGLEYLSGRGLRIGMLYVESDNDAATATYAGIGFTRHNTDRAYRRTAR